MLTNVLELFRPRFWAHNKHNTEKWYHWNHWYPWSFRYQLPALPGPTQLQASGVRGWPGRFSSSVGFAAMPYFCTRPWSWRWLNFVVWLNVSLVLVWSGLIEAEQYCKIPELWVSHFFPLPPSPLAKTILNSPGNGSRTIWDQTLCPFHNLPQNFSLAGAKGRFPNSSNWGQRSSCQTIFSSQSSSWVEMPCPMNFKHYMHQQTSTSIDMHQSHLRKTACWKRLSSRQSTA